MKKSLIRKHLSSLHLDAIQDIAHGKWDEVMTDALYSACEVCSAPDFARAKYAAETLMPDEIFSRYQKVEISAGVASALLGVSRMEFEKMRIARGIARPAGTKKDIETTIKQETE